MCIFRFYEYGQYGPNVIVCIQLCVCVFVYLWLMPLMTLVGDQSGSWAVNTTFSRNRLGFCSSGYADVSL